MSKSIVTRTNLFRWSSKNDLYNYFKRHYQLEQSNIDNEIHHVMENFRPRKFQVIKTSELWQKVGLNLEQRYGVRTSNGPIDNDLGIMDTVAIEEGDPNGTRKMPALGDNGNIGNGGYLITELFFTKKNVCN